MLLRFAPEPFTPPTDRDMLPSERRARGCPRREGELVRARRALALHVPPGLRRRDGRRDVDLALDVMMAVGERMSGAPLGDSKRPLLRVTVAEEQRVVTPVPPVRKVRVAASSGELGSARRAPTAPLLGQRALGRPRPMTREGRRTSSPVCSPPEAPNRRAGTCRVVLLQCRRRLQRHICREMAMAGTIAFADAVPTCRHSIHPQMWARGQGASTNGGGDPERVTSSPGKPRGAQRGR